MGGQFTGRNKKRQQKEADFKKSGYKTMSDYERSLRDPDFAARYLSKRGGGSIQRIQPDARGTGGMRFGQATTGYYYNGDFYKDDKALMAASDRGIIPGEVIGQAVKEGGALLQEARGERSRKQSRGATGKIKREGMKVFDNVAGDFSAGRFARDREEGRRPGRGTIVGGTKKRRKGTIVTGQKGLNEDAVTSRVVLG